MVTDDLIKKYGGTIEPTKPLGPAFALPEESKNALADIIARDRFRAAVSSPDVPSAPTATNLVPGTMATYASLQEDPLNLKANIWNAPGDAWNAVSGAFSNLGNKLSNSFDTTDTSAGSLLGKGLENVGALAGAVFSPISALFEGAKDIPILGSISKAISAPFEAAGELSGHAGAALLNDIPDFIMSEKTKRDLEPGVRDIFSLAGQIALGGAADGIGKKVIPSEIDGTKFEQIKTEIGNTNPEFLPEVDKLGAKTVANMVDKHGPLDAKEIIIASIRKAKGIPDPTVSELKPGVETNPAVSELGSGVETNPTVAQPEIIAPEPKTNVVATDKTADAIDNIPESKAVENVVTETPPDAAPMTREYIPNKMALDIQDKAVKNDLLADPVQAAAHEKMNVDLAKKYAVDLANLDQPRAMRILTGEEAVPPNTTIGAITKALADKATIDRDQATIDFLSSSRNLAHKSVTSGAQELRVLQEFSDSPVDAIREINKAATEYVAKRDKISSPEKAVNAEKDKIIESTRKSMPTKQSWSDFIDSIKC
jgi:hypothetical protein